ncbi:sugar nucleotide-binding protein [Streptomyces sp. NPDC059153]|uniref:sugar nucleotide-binding protein n=1 Tax=Streptomyces sp. NPDC059153 TaxID=3346743 RepID=UPI0036926128
MTVLIIGETGFLGSELVRRGSSAGRTTAATFHSRPSSVPGALLHHLDLRDLHQIDVVLGTVTPELVINMSSARPTG